MAAYPSIAFKSVVRPARRRDIDLSVAGTVRGVDLGQVGSYNILITHPLVTESERDTLVAFYDANKNANNTITCKGIDYSFQFVSEYEEESDGATLINMSVGLVGVKV